MADANIKKNLSEFQLAMLRRRGYSDGDIARRAGAAKEVASRRKDKHFRREYLSDEGFRKGIANDPKDTMRRFSKSSRLVNRDADEFLSTSVYRRTKARVINNVERGIYGQFGMIGEGFRQARRATSKAEARSIRRDYMYRYAANLVERNFGVVGEAWAQRIRNRISNISADNPEQAFQQVKKTFANISDTLLGMEKKIESHSRRIANLTRQVESNVTKVSGDSVTNIELTQVKENFKQDLSAVSRKMLDIEQAQSSMDSRIKLLEGKLEALRESATVVDADNDNKRRRGIGMGITPGNGNTPGGPGLLDGLMGAAAGYAGYRALRRLGGAARGAAGRAAAGAATTASRAATAMRWLGPLAKGGAIGYGAYKLADGMGIFDGPSGDAEKGKKIEEGTNDDPWWKQMWRGFTGQNFRDQMEYKKQQRDSQPPGENKKGLFGWGGLPETNKPFAVKKKKEDFKGFMRKASKEMEPMEAAIYRSKIEDEKKKFMQFGKLPEGFEFIKDNMGRLGSPSAVAATGAQPLGGDYQWAPSSAGGSGSALGTNVPYSSGGRQGGYGPVTKGTPGGEGSMPEVPYSGGLKEIREQRFRAQLTDDEIRKIAALGIVETGGMSARSKQAWLETYVNRATVRNTTLSSLREGKNAGYWGGGLGNPDRVSDKQLEEWRQHINKVMDGSNITDLATDNASNDYRRGNLLAKKRIEQGRKGVWTEGTTGDLIQDMDKGELAYIDKPYEKGVAKLREHLKSVEGQGAVATASKPVPAPTMKLGGPIEESGAVRAPALTMPPTGIDRRFFGGSVDAPGIAMSDPTKPTGPDRFGSMVNTPGVIPERRSESGEFNYTLSEEGQKEFGTPTPNLKTVPVKSASGKVAMVHPLAAPRIQSFLNAIESRGYKINDLGGFSYRNKNGGASGLSTHATGTTIDINPAKNWIHSSKTDMPHNIEKLAWLHGLSWGARFNDAMHFEIMSPGLREQRLKQLIKEGFITEDDYNYIKKNGTPPPHLVNPGTAPPPVADRPMTLEERYEKETGKKASLRTLVGDRETSDFKKWKEEEGAKFKDTLQNALPGTSVQGYNQQPVGGFTDYSVGMGGEGQATTIESQKGAPTPAIGPDASKMDWFKKPVMETVPTMDDQHAGEMSMPKLEGGKPVMEAPEPLIETPLYQGQTATPEQRLVEPPNPMQAAIDSGRATGAIPKPTEPSGGGGGGSGAQRHNPETRGPSPGSGGRGAAGRCFV